MKEKIKKLNVPFTQISNSVLNDKNLSWKAKGIFAYLYSKPENWDFETGRVSRDSKDGRDSTRSGIKELEDNGYIERTKKKDGRMEYFIKYDKKANDGKADFGNDVKSVSGNIRRISNKDINNNKEEIQVRVDSKDIQECIFEFRGVNPMYTRLFANKSERAAMERLLEKFGREKCMQMIGSLENITGNKYAPRITKPTQLENKLGELIVFVKQQRSGSKKAEIGIVL